MVPISNSQCKNIVHGNETKQFANGHTDKRINRQKDGQAEKKRVSLKYNTTTSLLFNKLTTVCPRSSYPFYEITYYIKWVTTSWRHSRCIVLSKL